MGHSGNTLVELILVMLLITLFGVMTSSLIYSGYNTQKRIIDTKNSQIDARIALSYINMKQRQNDEADMVSVEKNAITGDNSIVIKERGKKYQYDTWIFWDGGILLECLTNPGEQPSIVMSEQIAAVDGFQTYINEEGAMVSVVSYISNNAVKEMSGVIYLRSR